MIPCEICLELFDDLTITEHQVSLAVNVEFLYVYLQNLGVFIFRLPSLLCVCSVRSFYVTCVERKKTEDRSYDAEGLKCANTINNISIIEIFDHTLD